MNAEPQNTGVIFMSRAPLRIAIMISSIEISSPSTNFSSTASWHSATASTITSRRFFASAISSAGISPTVISRASSSDQMHETILTRSTTPWNDFSLPIGITNGTGLAFNRVRIESTAL